MGRPKKAGVLFGSGNPPRYWWKREDLWQEMHETIEEVCGRGQVLWKAYKHEDGELRRRIAVHTVQTRKSHNRLKSILRRMQPVDDTMVRAYQLLKRAEAAKKAGQVYMNPHELKMMVRKMARVLYNQERSRKRAREKKSGKSGR